MPRNPALVPFSHDHHEALLVALRLKKGAPSSPHDTLWPIEPIEQSEALFRFAEAELYPHFLLEEEILFPASINKSPSIDQLITSLLEDHSAMRVSLKMLKTSDSGELVEKMRLFGESLEKHIRREERELFPMIEEQIALGTIILDAEAIQSRKKSR